jgi:hypothetical protein
VRALPLALLSLAVAGWLAPAAVAPEPGRSPAEVLIRTLDRSRGGDLLLELSPVSLEPVSRPLGTFREVSGFAFSPDRGQLALGGGYFARGRLQLVDLPRWRARVHELGGRAPVSVIRWLAPDRLLVGLGGSHGRHVVGVVDPLRGAVLRTQAYRGLDLARAAGEYGIVILVSPRRRIRPARLVHVDTQGNLRSTALARIPAGFAWRGRGRSRVQRVSVPGLAVDPERGIAYIVAAGTPLVAEVDLASGQVGYHRLAESRELRRTRRTRAAKGGAFEERIRDARWLGDGALAVTGERRNSRPGRPFRYEPFGAWLVDTREWRLSLLDLRPTLIASARDRLLATGRHGPGWDHAGRRDAGLLAFDASGRRLFERFRGEDVTVLGVHSRYAYAWVRRTRKLHTVDLESGRKVHTKRVAPAHLPPLLAPEGFGGAG